MANPPPTIPVEHWHRAVSHWDSEEIRSRADINVGIRARGPAKTHSLGRSSIDRLKDVYVSFFQTFNNISLLIIVYLPHY